MLFIDSLLAALSPFTLAMNFVGVMLGMIVGALPGLGSVVAITICLPFTFGMTSISAIALLLGVYCGSICGGSISAVLINTPGTPQSAATAFDGYPMARAGKPGKAIGWALAASSEACSRVWFSSLPRRRSPFSPCSSGRLKRAP